MNGTINVFAQLILLSCFCTQIAACSSAATPPHIAASLPGPKHQATSQNSFLNIAHDLAAKGDHEAAIPIFRHIANSQGSQDAYVGLANSLMAMGDIQTPHQMLTRYLENTHYNPSADLYYAHGKASLLLGQFDGAQSSFEAALSLTTPASNKSRILSGLAIALAALGQTESALDAFGASNDTVALANKAIILSGSGDQKGAIAILERLVTEERATAKDRQNLAMAYLLAGNEKAARRTARLDLDDASVNATFQFYQALGALSQQKRFVALLTGAIDPAWSRRADGNLTLTASADHNKAAARMIKAQQPVAQKEINITDAQKQQEEAERQNYKHGDVPPVLEATGWALQIGAYRTTERLTRGWGLLLERNKDILGDIPPRRSEMDFGQQTDGPSGFYYRLNAGPLQSFDEARVLCNALIERGTPCWIRPPETSEGSLPTSNGEPSTAE